MLFGIQKANFKILQFFTLGLKKEKYKNRFWIFIFITIFEIFKTLHNINNIIMREKAGKTKF